MLGTYVFVGITVGAVLFMVRFLIAICGPEGKAAPFAYLAGLAPEHDDPSRCEGDRTEKCVNGQAETCPHSRRAFLVHARHQHPRRVPAWRGFVARGARRTRSEG